MITESDYEVLCLLVKACPDNMRSAGKIANFKLDAWSRAGIAKRLSAAGYLAALDLPYGKSGKTQRKYIVNRAQFPEKLPTWVVVLPPRVAGDPIQMVTPRCQLVASQDSRIALRFASEQEARSHLGVVRDRLKGYNPRVVDLENLSLV